MSIRPTSNDVLLGRGGNHWSNQGNVRLRNIALHRAREYATSTKKEKAVISREVLRQVKEAGSRFLKKSDYKADIWEEVSDEIAREKVCQVFRDHVAWIRDNTHRSDSSSPSEYEEEDGDSGADDEICHTRGSGGWEALRGLRKVKDEADNAFLSDRLATYYDLPIPDMITSSVVSPAAREHIESPRENFEADAVVGYSHSNDFDLFDGELLRSAANDEIFVTFPP